ncbi:translation initiation factor eIF4e [Dacryopinax primogenitus]|uniref:Translation initiation factor eIF4e n=1 Tax=Dacryopinax primogenitus (strain DJM 731) TaxID=1858805 RepID=M5FV00_DACPD|nr:translation initiation factor eIF4e [Dacryopinax primogenitus]EJT99384.1 translation initiation factor eIF4e [Dacryopinax primogenitus]
MPTTNNADNSRAEEAASDDHSHDRTKSGKIPTLDQLIAKIKPEVAASGDITPRPGATTTVPTNAGSRLRLPQTLRARAGLSSTETSPSHPYPPQVPDTATTTTSSSTLLSPVLAVAVHPPTAKSVSGAFKEESDQGSEAGEEHKDKGGKRPRGYKNVPSLEAISSRLALLRERSHAHPPSTVSDEDSHFSSGYSSDQSRPHSRESVRRIVEPLQDGERPYAMGPLADALSEAGESEAEEGEIVEVPAAKSDADQTPTQPKAKEKPSRKKDEHPLLHHWVWFYDSKVPRSSAPTTAEFPQSSGTASVFSPTTPAAVEPSPIAKDDYEANLHVIGEISTVEAFARYWNWCKPPSKLDRGCNYHFFKNGIKPMWEDQANSNGGKWVLTMRNNPSYLDKCWTEILMSLVGELSLDPNDEVTGCVVSMRSRIDRIQLWLRERNDVEKVNALGRRMADLLGIEQENGLMLEFQYHTDDWPNPGKYITLNTTASSGHAHTGSSSHSHSGPSREFGTTAAAAQSVQNGGGVMGSFSWRGSTLDGGGGGRQVRHNLFGDKRERD